MPKTFTSNKLRKVSLQYSNSTLSPPGSFSIFLVFLSLILCISQTLLNYCFCQLPPRKIQSCLVKSQDTKKGNKFLKKTKNRRVLWLSYHILTNHHMVVFTISHKLKPSKNKQLKVYLSSFIFGKTWPFSSILFTEEICLLGNSARHAGRETPAFHIPDNCCCFCNRNFSLNPSIVTRQLPAWPSGCSRDELGRRTLSQF